MTECIAVVMAVAIAGTMARAIANRWLTDGIYSYKYKLLLTNHHHLTFRNAREAAATG